MTARMRDSVLRGAAVSFHKIGHPVGSYYDLCEAEFNKLSENAKRAFEIVYRPGVAPVPYDLSATGVRGRLSQNSAPVSDYPAPPQTLAFSVAVIAPRCEHSVVRGVCVCVCAFREHGVA